MRAVVIGVGNRYRRDDAAGLDVVARISADDRPDVGVFEHDGEPAGLLDLWSDADVAYVVDAVRSGDPAGTVHRIEVGDGAVPDRPRRDSTHAIGLGDAVELARALGRLPDRLVMIGIEGSDFDAGEGLSADVVRASSRVARDILAEIEGVTH